MKNLKFNACLIGMMLVLTVLLSATTISATENQAPVANAGGPYYYNECDAIPFDGSQSYDPDGDTLQYRWDYNGDGQWDTGWQDTPYGDYLFDDDFQGFLILEVTDGVSISSDITPVHISNLDPVITDIVGPVDPVAIGTEVPLLVSFVDGDSRNPSADTFTATFNWGDGQSSYYNLPSGAQEVTGYHVYSQAGVYTVTITILDDNGGIGTGQYQFVVVYEPNVQPGTGFVTGGGWIVTPAGSYRPDPSITGTANFGFVSKYKKGQQTPNGETEFNFQEADLNFHSQSYDWLTVSGSVAQYKGTGTNNGAGSYGFILTATDGQAADTFRIQIWDKTTGTVIFDNNAGTVLSGGQIVIHRA